MEPQPTTPPDGQERASSEWRRFDGLEEDLTGGEDWSSRYGSPPPPPPRSGPDFSALFILLDGLRRAAPAELQDRLTALIREALLTLRSLIDWYLDRLDHRPREPEVEDIRID